MPASVLDRLSALADPTRTRILLLLDRFELTVRDLCVVLQMPQSTVSRHLKVLLDDQWLIARGEGLSRFYSMLSARLDAEAKDLWELVKAQVSNAGLRSKQDAQRAEHVLAKRRVAMRVFFTKSAGGVWDAMRTDMIGARADLLALLDLLDDSWVVGD